MKHDGRRAKAYDGLFELGRSSSELAVDLCDAALRRLPAVDPETGGIVDDARLRARLGEAQQAIYGLVTLVSPDGGEIATALLQLYEVCLFHLSRPTEEGIEGVRKVLLELREQFAKLDKSVPAELSTRTPSFVDCIG